MSARMASSSLGLITRLSASSTLSSRAFSSSATPVGKLMRSKSTGLRATIFGAYGFVGRYVTALLGTYLSVLHGVWVCFLWLISARLSPLYAQLPLIPNSLVSVRSAAAGGTQCIIPFRGDDMEWRHLKVSGDLGGVTPISYSPQNIDSVRRVIAGSDVVINLIGKVGHSLAFRGSPCLPKRQRDVSY